MTDSFENRKLKWSWRWTAAIALLGLIAVTVVVLVVLPAVARSQLEAKLGSRAVASILEEAGRTNAAALGAIGEPRIVVDIPVTTVVEPLKAQIASAASHIEAADGWTLTSVGEPEVKFGRDAINVGQQLRVANPDWGSAEIGLVINAIPSYSNGALNVAGALTDVRLVSLRPIGFELPGFVTSRVKTALLASLSSFNTLIPEQHLPVMLPARLVGADLANPALLVSSKSVSVMLGSSGGNGPTGGDYAEAYVAKVRTVFPEYRPGSGILVA